MVPESNRTLETPNLFRCRGLQDLKHTWLRPVTFQHLDPARTGFVPLQELRDFLGDGPDGLFEEMEDLIGFAMVEGLIVEE